MPKAVPSLFSRILTIVLVAACLAAAGWLGMSALEPMAVPPSPPAKGKVVFNPQADVSKDSVFLRLTPMGPSAVEAGTTGRVNPFVPPVMNQATSSKQYVVSSTDAELTTNNTGTEAELLTTDY